MSVGLKLTKMLEISEQPNRASEIDLFSQKILELEKNYLGNIDRKFLHQLLSRAQSLTERNNWLNKREVQEGEKSLEEYWHPNELKSFIWVLVCSAFLEGQSLVSNKISQTLELHPVIPLLFPLKTDTFLHYNLAQIQLKGRVKQEVWGSKE